MTTSEKFSQVSRNSLKENIMGLPNKEDIQPFIQQLRTWYENDV
ncbi:hypothetical protein [Okeania sp. SIO2B3]|nr:hypothetical protein [Okeania sp. SIO2B3]